jgi:hypothetical protein
LRSKGSALDSRLNLMLVVYSAGSISLDFSISKKILKAQLTVFKSRGSRCSKKQYSSFSQKLDLVA